MQTFDFLFGSIVCETILRNCDNLSDNLQKDVTAAEGKQIVALTVQTLQTIRNDVYIAFLGGESKKRQHDLKIDENTSREKENSEMIG